jgi:hypothetical protein
MPLPKNPNTKFYITILMLSGIILLLFLRKPRASEDRGSFASTLQEARATLDAFKAQNAQIEMAAVSLGGQRAREEAHDAALRLVLERRLDLLQGQLAAAQVQYREMMVKLDDLGARWEDLGAPDSLPTVAQLVLQNEGR